MLCGVNAKVYDQLERTDMVESLGKNNIFLDSSKLLYSSQRALQVAKEWLEKTNDKIYVNHKRPET
jgi:DNA-binding transcriptional regulator YhcF (GntR family)